MKITSYWPWEIKGKIDEIAAVADVYAATTNIIDFLFREPAELYLVNKESALAIKARDPEVMIIGEANDLPKNFFYAPNPPYTHRSLTIRNKVIYYMSINGTKKIELAFQHGANEVVALGFLNIAAVAGWIKRKHIKSVTLIASGESSYQDPKNPEDMDCILNLSRLLKGGDIDWNGETAKLMRKWERYYRGEDKHQIEEDKKIIFQVNSMPIVPVCTPREKGLIKVTRQ